MKADRASITALIASPAKEASFHRRAWCLVQWGLLCGRAADLNQAISKMILEDYIGEKDVREDVPRGVDMLRSGGCNDVKHLGLWEVKPRPPLKANGPTKIGQYRIDYSTSQLSESDNL